MIYQGFFYKWPKSSYQQYSAQFENLGDIGAKGTC